MSGRVEGKVAVVTGGAGTIGSAVTRRLAHEGARVIVADIERSPWDAAVAGLEAPDQDRVGFLSVNAGSDDDVRGMLSSVLEESGHIDILVATVGGSDDALIHKMSDEQWDHVIELNLRTAFIGCRALIPHLKERRYGKIVLISSRAALGNIGQVNYAAAKAGIIGFTRALARETARFGVNVNCVMPGFVDNPRVAHMAETFRQMRIDLNPFQSAALPADVADAVLFLASDEARQITGQTLRIACW